MSYESAKSVPGFIERLNSFVKESGTLYAFEKRTGFAKNTIKGYLEGAEPGRVRLAILAEKLGVRPEWLAYGVGERESSVKQGWTGLPELVGRRENPSAKLQVVRDYPPIMVRVDTVQRSFLGAPADKLLAFRMPDTSMSPLLLKDEFVLIDQSRRDPQSGGLFCVVYEEFLTIRHVGLIGRGRIKISAENEKVTAPIEYDFSELGTKFDVVGEAIIGCVWLNPSRLPSRIHGVP